MADSDTIEKEPKPKSRESLTNRESVALPEKKEEKSKRKERRNGEIFAWLLHYKRPDDAKPPKPESFADSLMQLKEEQDKRHESSLRERLFGIDENEEQKTLTDAQEQDIHERMDRAKEMVDEVFASIEEPADVLDETVTRVNREEAKGRDKDLINKAEGMFVVPDELDNRAEQAVGKVESDDETSDDLSDLIDEEAVNNLENDDLGAEDEEDNNTPRNNSNQDRPGNNFGPPAGNPPNAPNSPTPPNGANRTPSNNPNQGPPGGPNSPTPPNTPNTPSPPPPGGPNAPRGPFGGPNGTPNNINAPTANARETMFVPVRNRTYFLEGVIVGGVAVGLWQRRKRLNLERKLNSELARQREELQAIEMKNVAYEYAARRQREADEKASFYGKIREIAAKDKERELELLARQNAKVAAVGGAVAVNRFNKESVSGQKLTDSNISEDKNESQVIDKNSGDKKPSSQEENQNRYRESQQDKQSFEKKNQEKSKLKTPNKLEEPGLEASSVHSRGFSGAFGAEFARESHNKDNQDNVAKKIAPDIEKRLDSDIESRREGSVLSPELARTTDNESLNESKEYFSQKESNPEHIKEKPLKTKSQLPEVAEWPGIESTESSEYTPVRDALGLADSMLAVAKQESQQDSKRSYKVFIIGLTIGTALLALFLFLT